MSSSSNARASTTTTTTTSVTAQRRLMRDLRDLTQNPVEGINAAPVSADNIFQWNAILDGPEDSLFEDATFVLTLKFPGDYPNHPPEVKFVTKVFHPNICKRQFLLKISLFFSLICIQIWMVRFVLIYYNIVGALA